MHILTLVPRPAERKMRAFPWRSCRGNNTLRNIIGEAREIATLRAEAALPGGKLQVAQHARAGVNVNSARWAGRRDSIMPRMHIYNASLALMCRQTFRTAASL